MNIKKFTALLLLVVMAFAVLGMDCFDALKKKASPAPTTKPNYIYDTDPRNDDFIRGTLSAAKLNILDKVLLKEKKQGGLKLSNTELNSITKYDQEIIDAYGRWRKCKNMMRSSHHVIYPDER